MDIEKRETLYSLVADKIEQGMGQVEACVQVGVPSSSFSTWKKVHRPDLVKKAVAIDEKFAEARRLVKGGLSAEKACEKVALSKSTFFARNRAIKDKAVSKVTAMPIPEEEKPLEKEPDKNISVVVLKGDSRSIADALKGIL